MDPEPPPDLDDYDYPLPPEQIAQQPPDERDGGRLLALDRRSGAVAHGRVRDLVDLARDGDLLVVNTTRVVPARLRGAKSTGGAVEVLVLGADPGAPDHYRALLRSSGRQRVGQKLRFAGHGRTLDAEVVALEADGVVRLVLAPGADPYALGETPLPPYIRRTSPERADAERYQTTFARVPGSVAAPTAGLHLSHALLGALEAAGVERAEVVLHVGPGTFRPVDEAALRAGRLHPERFELPEATMRAVARTRARGGRVIAVGTTTTRVLEACAAGDGGVEARSGETELFLRPGSHFRVVDALLTNFHLPRSSLLLLVAAFAGRDAVLAAYAEAVAEGYRFYSYGDAMWIH